MKYLYTLLCLISSLFLLQSCSKEHKDQNELIVELFTYGARINWVEDSIKTDNGGWMKIEKGNVFTWLAEDRILDNVLKMPNGFATYDDTVNLGADFLHTISEDKVFQFRLSSDSIYFLGENDEYRSDIRGQISLFPDTSLILDNTAVMPRISIKYKLVK